MMVEIACGGGGTCSLNEVAALGTGILPLYCVSDKNLFLVRCYYRRVVQMVQHLLAYVNV
jgi:hypothetical protein